MQIYWGGGGFNPSYPVLDGVVYSVVNHRSRNRRVKKKPPGRTGIESHPGCPSEKGGGTISGPSELGVCAEGSWERERERYSAFPGRTIVRVYGGEPDPARPPSTCRRAPLSEIKHLRFGKHPPVF